MTARTQADDQNNTPAVEVGYALDGGLRLGALGYRVVPIGPGAKHPDITKWQTKATDDEATIRGWLEGTKRGVGWAMGMQPNGANLFTVDVDAHGADGTQALTRLIADNDPRSAAVFMQTVNAVTGGGGAHFVFSCPEHVEVRNTQRLVPGIDIRGEGGQIVVAPTVHPSTGIPYRWQRAPWRASILPAPAWLLDEMFRVPEPAPPSKGVSLSELTADFGPSGPEQTPADWVAENFPFLSMLEMNGWTQVSTRGDEVWLKRPGKTDDGHSAVLHGDKVLNIFSTEAPSELLRIGKQQRDCVSVSAFDFLAASQFGGDRSAAARWVRTERMPSTRPSPKETKEDRTDVGEAAGTADEIVADPVHRSQLDDEFWESRDYLRHIRRAAWSRMVAPEAALISVLARVSALTPPTMRLPAVIGSLGTLDFIGCVAAKSSGGKSISNDLAADLVPSVRKDVLLDLPVGSGEGLVQSFMVPEVGDDGKPTGKQVVGLSAVHFTVDEGTALMEQQSRRGTTIVQTLCSAWSGRALGQANASMETRRIIEPRRVRVAAVINIQTANAHLLLADQMVAVGFPQRVVWASAEDADMPRDLPDWPGELIWTPPPTVLGGNEMTVDEEIVSELREQRWRVATGRLVIGALDGHAGLSRLKLAALLALLDLRVDVTFQDWELAEQILLSSNATRDHAVEVKEQLDSDVRHRQTEALAEREITIDANKEQHAITLLAGKLANHLDEPMSVGKLARKTTSSGTRHRFHEALTIAKNMGLSLIHI